MPSGWIRGVHAGEKATIPISRRVIRHLRSNQITDHHSTARKTQGEGFKHRKVTLGWAEAIHSLRSARIYTSWVTTNERTVNRGTFLLIMFLISFPIQLSWTGSLWITSLHLSHGTNLIKIQISLEILPKPGNSITFWFMDHHLSCPYSEFTEDLPPHRF